MRSSQKRATPPEVGGVVEKMTRRRTFWRLELTRSICFYRHVSCHRKILGVLGSGVFFLQLIIFCLVLFNIQTITLQNVSLMYVRYVELQYFVLFWAIKDLKCIICIITGCNAFFETLGRTSYSFNLMLQFVSTVRRDILLPFPRDWNIGVNTDKAAQFHYSLIRWSWTP